MTPAVIEQLKFDVELVTPAFPGGVDPENKDLFDGVRTESVVYGMRWWFRSFAGAAWGWGDLAAIREAESHLFGTAQDRGRPASLRIAVTGNSAGNAVSFAEQYGRNYALRYLGYGVDKRRGLPPGVHFQFRILSMPSPRDADRAREQKALAELLAQCWIAFGGLGARWRHGLGSMVQSGPRLSSTEYPQWALNLLERGRRAVKAFLQKNFPENNLRREAGLPSYPVALPPYLRLAWQSSAGNGWEDAMRGVYNIYRDSRLSQPGNPRSSTWNAGLFNRYAEGDPVAGDRAELVGLGLPIPFQIRGKTNKGTSIRPVLRPREGEPESKGGRRASPLWFRVVPLQGGGCGVLALLWRCQFLPDKDAKLVIGEPKREAQELAKWPQDEAAEWFQNWLLGRRGFRAI